MVRSVEIRENFPSLSKAEASPGVRPPLLPQADRPPPDLERRHAGLVAKYAAMLQVNVPF
jgi:hypothetical protein